MFFLHAAWVAAFFAFFYGTDRAFTACGLQGVYYALHALHNAAIVRITGHEVWLALTDFNTAVVAPQNFRALQLVFALHIYHIAAYWRKFRTDDWLHHALMIGIALPIGGLADSGALLGYSLFFATGLPGGIDYALLFMNRNGWLKRETEKRVNTWLNVWIRSPGTISLAALTAVRISSAVPYTPLWWSGIVTALLNYWNGQYFMQQVVYNLGQEHTLRSLGGISTETSV